MLPPPDAPGHHHMARGCQIMVKVLPHLDKPNAEWLGHVLALDSGWPHYQIADHLTAALASVNNRSPSTHGTSATTAALGPA